jgi:hypothetical protein
MAQEERRRSPRISTSIPIQASWTGADGKFVEEQTNTEVFSNLGARILVKNTIEVGQEIKIINQHNQESMLGRVVWVSDYSNVKGRLAAFEFLTPAADFWGTVAYGS